MKEKSGKVNLTLAKKLYVRPELIKIRLDDEETLSQLFKGKSFDIQKLKEEVRKIKLSIRH